MKPLKLTTKILFQATPFCYGPSSIAIAIANEIYKSKYNSGNIELLAIGEGTSYELFKTSKIFDKVIEYIFSKENHKKLPSIIKILQESDIILSVVDFDFVNFAKPFNKNIFLVDPLYWMWTIDPISTESCKRYYAPYFPGIEKRIEQNKKRSKSFPFKIVAPICIKSNLQKTISNKTDSTLLVNFGGIESPLGSNIELVITVSQLILDVVKEYKNITRVFICGGENPIKEVSNNLKLNNDRDKVAAKSQTDFLASLSNCHYFMTVPGLSVIYESIQLNKSILIIPPLNYSQHLQLKQYKKILNGAEYITWAEIPGYELLPNNLSEIEGVKLAINLGAKFSNDQGAQSFFKQRIRSFLSSNGVEAVSFRKPIGKSLNNFDGAEYIANDILSRFLVNIPL